MTRDSTETRTEPVEARPLRDLLDNLDPAECRLPSAGTDVPIAGVTFDSRRLRPGDLFVAIAGTSIDGHDFVDEAVQRGAAAVVVERELSPGPSVPVVVVANGRRALARLAAAWYRNACDDLILLGISGTLGKTSVLSMLQEILADAGADTGSIGSLGVFRGDTPLGETGHTAPDPLQLHRSLARLRDEGCDLVMMEVTSHALAQERVHGMRLDYGVFTNIVPLEHQDYHGTFADYVTAKSRFFDLLKPGAPLVYNGDDLAVAALVADRDLRLLPVGTAEDAAVRISGVRTTAKGTGFDLEFGANLPTAAVDAPERLPVRVQLLGGSNVMNAALAATAALVLGVSPEYIQSAMARIPSPHRRMELIHRGEFQILDDTVGHPESISALFGVIEALAPKRIHIAFAVRGMRGTEINEQTATTLATWLEKMPAATLVVTRSEEAADERNTVSDDEAAAFRAGLDGLGIPCEETRFLGEAVLKVLDRAENGDLVLLLGAQGMDQGAAIAREWLTDRTRPVSHP